MKRIIVGTFMLAVNVCTAQGWKTEDQYIQKFAHLAVEQMHKYKIPASITLAQGLLETAGGQSRLAKEGNNHFGIKCKENWTGKSMKHNDDAPNECFRVYDSPAESYEDHSIFLTTRKHYSPLFQLDVSDYKGWAHGLKRAGYATNPRYAYGLIAKIERYSLHEFDVLSLEEVKQILLKKYPTLVEDTEFMATMTPKKEEKVSIPQRQRETSVAVVKYEKPREVAIRENLQSILVRNHPNGGLKYIVIPSDMDLKLVADKYNIALNRLQKWNELDRTQVYSNEIIFLEAKNSEGVVENYVAVSGDTMHGIAQKFGVRVDKLYGRNEMHPGTQPKAGEVIYLKGRKPRI